MVISTLKENVLDLHLNSIILLIHKIPESMSTPSKKPKSSSGRKLSFDNYNNFKCSGKENCFFYVLMLSAAIKQFATCKYCKYDDSIELIFIDNFKNGLAVFPKRICTVCSESKQFHSSRLSADGKLHDINLKFVYAMRTIGKGFTVGNVLCALLDLPQPPQKYAKYHTSLITAVQAEDSMLKITEEVIIENVNSNDFAVALDGSCQRRGHASLNGFVSVTCFDTGKVLDVAVMSKYCQTCATKKP